MNDSADSIVQTIALIGVTRGLVKRLPGFDKSRHTVPKWASERAQQFIGSICEPELREWGEGIFSELRTAMSYKRKDLRLTLNDGEAVMEAKDFALKRRYFLNEEDLSEYIVETELLDLGSAELLRYAKFNDAIGPLFDQLRCLFRKEQSVEGVIDAIEEASTSEIRVDYPSDCESCEVRIEGVDAVFRFDSISVTVKLPRFCSPCELANAIEGFSSAIKENGDLADQVPLPF